MKFLVNRNVFFLFLIPMLGCNPGTIERYPTTINPQIPAINIQQNSPEDCYPGSLPGTENPTDLGNVFVKKDCQRLCYNNYQALPKNYDPNSYLSFPVPGYLGVGKCRGHAIVTQQFSMLARFGKGANKEKCGPSNMTSFCLIKYKALIEKITNGYEVTDVPGFPSLLHFSSHPEIRKIIYQKVIKYGHRYSAGYGYVERTTSNDKSNTFYELFKKANNNQKPYVGIKTSFGTDHAIIINKAAYINGKQVLCASDPNQRDYTYYKNESCNSYITNEDGKIRYHTPTGISPLFKFNVFTDDDERTLKYVNAWKKKCMEEKSAMGECSLAQPLIPTIGVQ